MCDTWVARYAYSNLTHVNSKDRSTPCFRARASFFAKYLFVYFSGPFTRKFISVSIKIGIILFLPNGVLCPHYVTWNCPKKLWYISLLIILPKNRGRRRTFDPDVIKEKEKINNAHFEITVYYIITQKYET